MKADTTSNPYASELTSKAEGWVEESEEPKSSSVAHVCAMLGMIGSVPVVISISAAVLSVALGSIDRINAGGGTSFDNLLALLGFHMILLIVLILCGLPSFALSLGGFIACRDRLTGFALFLAVAPVPIGFFLLIVLG